MSAPSAIVVPFGVPPTSQGLGLGVAGLVHELVRVGGAPVALGQFHSRTAPDDGERKLIEAIVTPTAWRDIVANGNAPSDVPLVMTGAIEPPDQGYGTVYLQAFDGRTGEQRAKIERPFEDLDAGSAIVGAFEELALLVGGDLADFKGIEQLSWDPLVNVCRAQRCLIADPVAERPADRNAALLYLERAVEEAPSAEFAAGRLASLALDTLFLGKGALSERSFAMALRVLQRAVSDAPDRPALQEALALIETRQGLQASALERLRAIEQRWPLRPTAYALMAQAHAARGALAEAKGALDRGLATIPAEPALLTEKGNLYAAEGNTDAAVAIWRKAFMRSPMFVPAFHHAAGVALGKPDVALAQQLVDVVLSLRDPSHDVVRQGISLALRAETDGIARSSRVSHLGRLGLAHVPGDVFVATTTVRALLSLGEVAEAKAVVERLEAAVASSALAPEVERLRVSVHDPELARELDELQRRARTGPKELLSATAAAARNFALTHRLWWAWHAAAIAEIRMERWTSARSALEEAMKLAPTAVPVHVDLVPVLTALGAPQAAISHAERALALEGTTSAGLLRLAEAQIAAGKIDAAKAVGTKLDELFPSSEEARSLLPRLSLLTGRTSWIDRLKTRLTR